MWEQELGRLREAAAQQLLQAEWRHEDEVAKLRLRQVRGSGWVCEAVVRSQGC